MEFQSAKRQAQSPNPKFQTSSKFQIPEASRPTWPACHRRTLVQHEGGSFWSLVLGASLGFGAWDLELCNIPKPTVDTAAPTQSGDSEDSVATVQEARAPTRAALGSWSEGAVDTPWRLPMNRKIGR